MAAIFRMLCEGTIGDLISEGNKGRKKLPSGNETSSLTERENGVVHSTQHAVLWAIQL
jgi:hypothetical protein